MSRANEILRRLKIFIPTVSTELVYNGLYQLTVAVVLSAQTTDKAVNKATPFLFSRYSDFYSLAAADYQELKEIIKTVGLAPTKAKNLIKLSRKLVTEQQGMIVPEFAYLITLPGVGRKTANVILSEGFGIPRMAVDTHVLRVAKRLALVDSPKPQLVEARLCELYPPEEWHGLHLRLVFFGRYYCKAKKPSCDLCPLPAFCHYYTNYAPEK
ncbi:MAG: endonuclease III [Bacilli bacterium]|nr:endonuclease III [Bacilli bacterium]